MDHYLHYDSLNISKEWFGIGQAKQADAPSEVAFRFVAYWIAFNGFYGRVEKRGSEQNQIEDFLNTEAEKLSGLLDFNPTGELKVFFDAPVFGGKRVPKSRMNYNNPALCDSRIQRYQRLKNSNENEQQRIVDLMLTIYQVRCNMFHGEKTPSPERNYNLVYASQLVLEKLLKALIRNT